MALQHSKEGAPPTTRLFILLGKPYIVERPKSATKKKKILSAFLCFTWINAKSLILKLFPLSFPLPPSFPLNEWINCLPFQIFSIIYLCSSFQCLKQKESNSEMEVWWLSDSYFLVGTLFLSGIFLNFLFVFDILKLHHNVSKYCFFPVWHSMALFTWSFSPSFNSGKLVFIHLSNISSALFLCFFPLRTFIF